MEGDESWMQLAIEEARCGVGLTSPNPAVGAVIVKDGLLLGKGWHHKAGLPHAEREAIAAVTATYGVQALRGSTIYVTLEPCSSHGKTPPCTQGILDTGISRVVYGAEDPNPQHRGVAKSILEAAGVDVCSEVLASACEDLIRGFAKVQRTGLPWVILKSALSLDGRVTRPPGEGQWLTSPESRERVQRIRFECDAIITGGRTFRVDNPSLTLRSPSLPPKDQPWRMVMTRGKASDLPSKHKMFTDTFQSRTLVHEGGNPQDALRQLADLGCQTVLLEAGGRLVSSFLREFLVDELFVFYAPMLTGGPDLGFEAGLGSLELSDQRFERIGDDVLLRAKVVS
ncbi:bifunctional diaminohydroxyphosphoribosylaminopyrimidine deaminase/5-amino-6-(5-phosphoribosylamino)uracil reductase RibD [Verrucomicrobiaceae bacterium N1E253]|uniref:Riboflavin biosynthesis protein RibD n=1 Tax=Oceaniferula marina TaxID=2748318 RepID=A0A851GAY8_9BACT|nr:bifunctional diaminohydroxyphosphoribosylaminopyrimidine deaminase/5-amino-6-(5-phosphoribosylamino)uracil reductase RibD [Oceaniferula marina]NWK54928.1 bifunctional diaminohydroxyphosphoribosylaminopyrimidine deaminase/5-amino-6-(5-phosphoribosylamino)uracil reductase RibD [Oceaniferula marina]